MHWNGSVSVTVKGPHGHIAKQATALIPCVDAIAADGHHGSGQGVCANGSKVFPCSDRAATEPGQVDATLVHAVVAGCPSQEGVDIRRVVAAAACVLRSNHHKRVARSGGGERPSVCLDDCGNAVREQAIEFCRGSGAIFSNAMEANQEWPIVARCVSSGQVFPEALCSTGGAKWPHH